MPTTQSITFAHTETCPDAGICPGCDQPACLEHGPDTTTCIDRLGKPEPVHVECHRAICRLPECDGVR